MTSAKPFGGFIDQLALYWWGNPIPKPKHYLKQFHSRYTPMEELKPLLKEESLSEDAWAALFNTKNGAEVIGKPVLAPWVIVEEKPGQYSYERNPYYFKVDPAGNQLPYIDKRQSTLVSSLEMAVMKTVAGEVDFLEEPLNLKDFPILKENEKKGGYRVQIQAGEVEWVAIINLSHQDPVWSKLVGDVRFLRALNMAVNREEIIDTLCYGMGGPTNMTPSKYDPEKANQLLDEVGLDKRDKEGWRLGPDGERFVIPFEVAIIWAFELDTAELVAEHFKEVGIYTTVKHLGYEMWSALGNNNERKATIIWANYPFWRVSPVAYREYLPSTWNNWGAPWKDWHDTGGEMGIQGPEKAERILELADVIQKTTSEEERASAIDEIISSYLENIWQIGLIQPRQIIVSAANLGNVEPAEAIASTNDLLVDQYFYKE